MAASRWGGRSPSADGVGAARRLADGLMLLLGEVPAAPLELGVAPVHLVGEVAQDEHNHLLQAVHPRICPAQPVVHDLPKRRHVATTGSSCPTASSIMENSARSTTRPTRSNQRSRASLVAPSPGYGGSTAVITLASIPRLACHIAGYR